MNILVLCDYGQTRSVAMATVLGEHGHFAVAGAYDSMVKAYDKIRFNAEAYHSQEIFRHSFDRIIYMQEGGEHFIGRDTYPDWEHPELIMKCYEKAKELGLLEKKRENFPSPT